MNPPFFIVGCVRSGTTLLRDILRRHPSLVAPEETHFFRWPDPFGTRLLTRTLTGNAVLKKHRELDGIGEDEFRRLLAQSRSRSELTRRYVKLFASRCKPAATRWFDKTPQNVYGAPMIAMQFPAARFVHIVRNPLDVVASLRIGRVVAVAELVGACNYWTEAAEIVSVLKAAYPRRVHELRYEDLTADFPGTLAALLDFVGENLAPDAFADVVIQPPLHAHEQLFSAAEIATIRDLCSPWLEQYGYGAPGAD